MCVWSESQPNKLSKNQKKKIKPSTWSEESDDDLAAYFSRDSGISTELEDYPLQDSNSSDLGTELEVETEEQERDGKLTVGSWVIELPEPQWHSEEQKQEALHWESKWSGAWESHGQICKKGQLALLCVTGGQGYVKKVWHYNIPPPSIVDS